MTVVPAGRGPLRATQRPVPGGQTVPVTTASERIDAGRRRRQVLARVTRAAWRLEQAEQERQWALASARAEGVSIRELAKAAGLSPTRVHQIVSTADPDEVDTTLADLRTAGWPAPEDPDGDEDAELDGRDLVADRLGNEVAWLRTCAGWLVQLETGQYPPAVNLRPDVDWPETANVMVTGARVAAVLQRVAADLDELARARRIADLQGAAERPDRRAERRRPSGRTRPGVPRLLHPTEAARLLHASAATRLGRLAGRAVPPRRDRPAPRLHRQPVPTTLTRGSSPSVQQTERDSGVPGSVLTGTPTR